MGHEAIQPQVLYLCLCAMVASLERYSLWRRSGTGTHDPMPQLTPGRARREAHLLQSTNMSFDPLQLRNRLENHKADSGADHANQWIVLS